MQKLMLAVALMAALPVVAQSPKEPWALTVEERIALRTDPKLASERLLSERNRKSVVSSESNDAQGWVDSFTGQTHPELFLPHEVFRTLIGLAFLGPVRTGEVVRRGHMPDVKRHGLPPDFWERLRSISGLYIADSWAETDTGQSISKLNGSARSRAEEALALKQVDVCRSRADALAAARSEFGTERFDRFLYEVIAVTKFHATDRLLDAELLRRAEKGCR